MTCSRARRSWQRSERDTASPRGSLRTGTLPASTRPELAELEVSDLPARWEALGFTVADSRVELGGVDVRLGAESHGITGWAVRGTLAPTAIDGLRTRVVASDSSTSVAHPNGAIGIDHVVVVTPDFDRTGRALGRAGMPFSRVRDAGGFRQGFRRLGPAILEVVEARGEDSTGEARFWGLVVVVADLDALADRLGDLLGEIRPAVQAGRRIATLSPDAGLSEAVAFMDPEPRD